MRYSSLSTRVSPIIRKNLYRSIAVVKSPLLKEQTVSIIGCPLNFGQSLSGVDMGPKVIRGGKLLEEGIIKEGWKVQDMGDLDLSTLATSNPQDPKNAKNARFVGWANHKLALVTKQVASEGKFALTLGGDHAIGIGSIAGLLSVRPDLGLIWVDAHADINTPSTTGSGNIHGMPVSFLMDLDNIRKVPGFEWMESYPKLLHNRMVFIGLRDVDLGERRLIREFGIRAYTMHDIDRYGIGKVMEMALDHVCNRVERPLHLSFDIDAVDPVFAPSTGTRVYGGLTYREAYYITETVALTGQLTSMDLVEVNPLLTDTGLADQTAQIARGMVLASLGNTLL